VEGFKGITNEVIALIRGSMQTTEDLSRCQRHVSFSSKSARGWSRH